MIRMTALAPVALMACAPTMPATESAAPAPPTSGVRCDGNAVAALVGRPADAVVADAQRLSGARTVRRYVTGDMLTMDFNPERLNVETNASDNVVKFSCG